MTDIFSYLFTKVVCIAPEYDLYSSKPRLIRAGQELGVFEWPRYRRLYTVRGVVFRDDRAFLRFDEVVNPIVKLGGWTGEQGFPAEDFRPVVTRSTDISIFKAMLTPKNVEVAA